MSDDDATARLSEIKKGTQAASTFTQKAQLYEWGWEYGEYAPVARITIDPISAALESLGALSSNVGWNWEHIKQVFINGVNYEVSANLEHF